MKASYLRPGWRHSKILTIYSMVMLVWRCIHFFFFHKSDLFPNSSESKYWLLDKLKPIYIVVVLRTQIYMATIYYEILWVMLYKGRSPLKSFYICYSKCYLLYHTVVIDEWQINKWKLNWIWDCMQTFFSEHFVPFLGKHYFKGVISCEENNYVRQLADNVDLFK